MQQYFLSKPLQINEVFYMMPDQEHHVVRVMRYGVGKQIRVVDSTHQAYLCVIQQVSPLLIQAVSQLDGQTELPVEVTLIVGWIKKEKFEWMLQKVSEAGATRVIPLLCEHSVVKEKEETLSKKLLRYNKITEEAAEQSRRVHSTEVLAPISLPQVSAYLSSVNVVAYEKESSKHFKHVCQPHASMTILIGPEGGFSTTEIDQLMAMGVQPVTLGPRIYRTETAALASCVMIDAMLG